MKSKLFRTDSLFLRNAYETAGRWQLPLVHKQKIDLDKVDLISISDTKYHDNSINRRKGVHFFVDDYKFESMYRSPERALFRLSQYAFVCTPDYSTYSDMNYWRQLESVAPSRWCGAFWQDQGLLVVPTITWSTLDSFDFCFDGVERGSIVAIGMIGCKRNKQEFLLGYNKMLNVIDPTAIICFGTPFAEMKGPLFVVDYLSSRKVVR